MSAALALISLKFLEKLILDSINCDHEVLALNRNALKILSAPPSSWSTSLSLRIGSVYSTPKTKTELYCSTI